MSKGQRTASDFHQSPSEYLQELPQGRSWDRYLAQILRSLARENSTSMSCMRRRAAAQASDDTRLENSFPQIFARGSQGIRPCGVLRSSGKEMSERRDTRPRRACSMHARRPASARDARRWTPRIQSRPSRIPPTEPNTGPPGSARLRLPACMSGGHSQR
jgi:hypothetical protein